MNHDRVKRKKNDKKKRNLFNFNNIYNDSKTLKNEQK